MPMLRRLSSHIVTLPSLRQLALQGGLLLCSWGARQQQQSTSEWLAGGGRRRHLRQALSESPPQGASHKGDQAGDPLLQGGQNNCHSADNLPRPGCHDGHAAGDPVKGGLDSRHDTGKLERCHVKLRSEPDDMLPAASAHSKARDAAMGQPERDHIPAAAHRDRFGSCSLDIKAPGRCP